MDLTDEEAQLIRGKIEALKVEHRDLDDIIERLARDPNLDELQIRRLKRRKLLLKDQIARETEQIRMLTTKTQRTRRLTKKTRFL